MQKYFTYFVIDCYSSLAYTPGKIYNIRIKKKFHISTQKCKLIWKPNKAYSWRWPLQSSRLNNRQPIGWLWKWDQAFKYSILPLHDRSMFVGYAWIEGLPLCILWDLQAHSVRLPRYQWSGLSVYFRAYSKMHPILCWCCGHSALLFLGAWLRLANEGCFWV